MTAFVLLVAVMLAGKAVAVVELNCSDNATCIDHMAKELARNLRQQKTVKIFDLMTIEPLGRRQARSSKGLLTRFLENHAFSFDWNDFTFKVSQTADGSDALDVEVYEGRTAKDVSDLASKKSSSKAEEEKEEDKAPKLGLRRRHKKKVLQALVPLLFGMKSAGAVIFAFTLVAIVTIKAFVASKTALLVTVGMAMKKLYDSYSGGVGLQNHPYLYSQYPIDFPSASSHAYSVSGVSPQFASPEMYSPTAMGTHAHAHDLLQNDASAQQSQQAPTLLINSTRAAERWDGKSKLLKFLEPVINGFKTILNPIASVVYDAMPATFRGLNTDVSTTKSYEEPVGFEAGEEVEIKKPREILVPQPRNIAQRKMTLRRIIPKKYTELKVNMSTLKFNKDLNDYIKTKKYKFNYPRTYYYPRIKYFVNPNSFHIRPNNSRLVPYARDTLPSNVTKIASESEWTPIVTFNQTLSAVNDTKNKRKHSRSKQNKNNHRRFKRSIDIYKMYEHSFSNASKAYKIVKKDASKIKGRGFLGFFDIFFSSDPLEKIMNEANKYTKSVFKESLKSEKPQYYSTAYDALVVTLDVINGLFEVEKALGEHLFGKSRRTKTKKRKADKLKEKKNIIHKQRKNHL